VAALGQIKPTLDKEGVGLVLMACATIEQTKEFLEGLELPLPGELYIDLPRNSHKAFKLFRGVWQSLITPLWEGIPKYGWRGLIEGCRLGFETAHLAGDSWQQGGTFLLGPGQVCHFAHRETHPADWADMNFITKKFISKGEGEGEVLDYPKAIATYLDARANRKVQTTSKNAGIGRTWIVVAVVLVVAVFCLFYW